MNYEFFLNDIRFEWDTEKASANLNKHLVSFESACEIFSDPFLKVVAIEFVDDEQRANGNRIKFGMENFVCGLCDA